MLLFVMNDTSACTCGRDSEWNGLGTSEYVVLADVLYAEVRLVDGREEELVVGIRPLEFVKGKRDISEVFGAAGSGNCGITIRVPGRYWFYLDKDLRTDSCSATRPDLATELPQLKKLLKHVLIRNSRRIRDEMQKREDAAGN